MFVKGISVDETSVCLLGIMPSLNATEVAFNSWMTKSIVFVNLQRKGDLKLASKTCLDCNALTFKGSMEINVIKVCDTAFKNS